ETVQTAQSNRLMSRLKQTITNKVISEIGDLAEEDAEKYAALWAEFGRLIKEGVITDNANKDKLANLLRFKSSKADGWTSLKEYVSRMSEGQEEIYYLLGTDVNAITHSPHLEAFKSRDLEVLLMTDTIDGFMINALPEFDGKKLHNASDADLKLPEKDKADEDKPEEPAVEDAALQTLITRFEDALGDRVASVRESKVLTESAARLVSADKGFGADMERVYRALGQEYEAPKRILEINPRHQLIRNLSEMDDAALAGKLMEALYGNALLIEGIHPNPAEMVPLIQTLMEAAAKK
ncbi:MAG: molecular chaperone HtpG, partial [Anaerolineae bacterium]|nr:molecular chaperone HtpG [Anaerolineae bacterium]